MPYKLSPSTIGLYFDCPKCFYMSLKEKIWRPRDHFPSLPSGMDSLVKNRFDEYRAKKQLPPELSDLDDLLLFDNMILLNDWRNQRKGMRWEDKKGNAFVGSPDEILVNPKTGMLVVLDYKTKGFAIKEDPAGQYNYKFQLEAYNFLLRKLGFLTADYAYLLVDHPVKFNPDRTVQIHCDLLGFKIDVKRPEKVFKTAITLLENDKRPDPSENCEYCMRVSKIIEKKE